MIINMMIISPSWLAARDPGLKPVLASHPPCPPPPSPALACPVWTLPRLAARGARLVSDRKGLRRDGELDRVEGGREEGGGGGRRRRGEREDMRGEEGEGVRKSQGVREPGCQREKAREGARGRERERERDEQSPNHRHRNLKAFEEHTQTHVSVSLQNNMYVTFLG